MRKGLSHKVHKSRAIRYANPLILIALGKGENVEINWKFAPIPEEDNFDWNRILIHSRIGRTN